MGSSRLVGRIYHFDTDITFFRYLRAWRRGEPIRAAEPVSPSLGIAESLYNLLGGLENAKGERGFNPLFTPFYPQITELWSSEHVIQYPRICWSSWYYLANLQDCLLKARMGIHRLWGFWKRFWDLGNWEYLGGFEQDEVREYYETYLPAYARCFWDGGFRGIPLELALVIFRCFHSYLEWTYHIQHRGEGEIFHRYRTQAYYRGLGEYFSASLKRYAKEIEAHLKRPGWSLEEMDREGEDRESEWGTQVAEFFHILSFTGSGEAWFFGPGSYALLPPWFLATSYPIYPFAYDGQFCETCRRRGALWGWRRRLETEPTPLELQYRIAFSPVPVSLLGHVCLHCLPDVAWFNANARYHMGWRRNSRCELCGGICTASHVRKRRCELCLYFGGPLESRAEWFEPWDQIGRVRREAVPRSIARLLGGWRFRVGLTETEKEALGNYVVTVLSRRDWEEEGRKEDLEDITAGLSVRLEQERDLGEGIASRIAELFVPLGRDGGRYFYAVYPGRDGYGLISVEEGEAKLFALDTEVLRDRGVRGLKRALGTLSESERERFRQRIAEVLRRVE